jgi:hypothetical protein
LLSAGQSLVLCVFTENWKDAKSQVNFERDSGMLLAVFSWQENGCFLICCSMLLFVVWQGLVLFVLTDFARVPKQGE